MKAIQRHHAASERLSDDFFRIVRLSEEDEPDDIFCIISLDVSTGDFDISITNSNFMPIKLLDEIPLNALASYCSLRESVNIWIREEDVDFPIERDESLISRYSKLLSDPADIEADLEKILADSSFNIS